MTKNNPTHKGQVGQAGANDKNRGEFARHDRTSATDGVVKPLRNAGVYGGYQVKAFESSMTGELTADIYREGELVVRVENPGNGGANFYHPAVSGSNECSRFENFAAKAYGDVREPADEFVEFLEHARRIDELIEDEGLDRDSAVEAVIAEQNAHNEQYNNLNPKWEIEYEFLRHPGALDEIAA